MSKKSGPSYSKWLFVGLGALAVVAVIVMLVNRGGDNEPTLNAAPKIVSTPDHPIVIHTKSPEVYRMQMEQAGVPEKARTPGAPPAGTE